MAVRPTTMFIKSPPASRGVSPRRPAATKGPLGTPPRQRRSPGRLTSPSGPTGPTFGALHQDLGVVGAGLTNGNHMSRKTQAPRIRPSPSRGSSPGNSAGSLPASRGSESGSSEQLDNLDNDGSLQGEDNINVVVRVRPLNKKEYKGREDMVVQFPGNGQLMLEAGPGQPRPRLFSFNAVFEPGATQADVLRYSGVTRLIEMAVDGFNCTVFCYGQTGSGKTHTLTGPPGLFNGNPDPHSEDHGLVFRSFLYLFQLLKQREDFHFVLKASFLEIYNEKVIDLLNPGSARRPLAVRWSKKQRGFFVENLFTVDCEELDDLLAVLEEGMKNRSVGSHGMNDHSSRSHTILTVYITAERQVSQDGVFISRQGKLNFVDLAGSEMSKKTHSEGKTLEEANNINKSLMVLGYCIASLSDQRKKNGHIPYRDSKLTKLLADSLAGNGVTLMIACISPARSNLNESLNTLRYAARAKKIRTKPFVAMDPREALILSLKREVSALQSENHHLRSALNLGGDQAVLGRMATPGGLSAALTGADHGVEPPPLPEDLEKLAELEGAELARLVRHYVTENEALRRENSELFTSRDLLMRDQELVCRENERLLKKLEDVNSVCCRSPIIPARPTYSGEVLAASMIGSASDGDLAASTNVWVNPLSNSAGKTVLPGPRFRNEILDGRSSRVPDAIQKELDKRRIGDSLGNIAESYRSRSHQRHSSWDNMRTALGTAENESESIDGDGNDLRKITARTESAGDLAKSQRKRTQSEPMEAKENGTSERRFSLAKPLLHRPNSLLLRMPATRSNSSPASLRPLPGTANGCSSAPSTPRGARMKNFDDPMGESTNTPDPFGSLISLINGTTVDWTPQISRRFSRQTVTTDNSF